MPPSVRVLLILAKYAAFGVIPQVIPAVVDDPPLPTEQIPQQQGTDYGYVSELAQEAGYVFYLEPGPTPGTSSAYWGPEIRVGMPQPALTTGMDALSNVEQLSLQLRPRDEDHPDRLLPGAAEQARRSACRSRTSRRSTRRSAWCRRCRRRSSTFHDTGHLPPGLAMMARPRLRGAAQRLRVRQRHARRREVRPPAQVAPAGRRARRGPAVRRALLRQERLARHPARRLQAERFRSRATGCSRPCRRCRHERQALPRHISRRASRTTSTPSTWRASRCRSRTSAAIRSRPGRCPACRSRA